MTILEALNAIPATSELKQRKLPFGKSKALFQLRKALENMREFYIEEERKLIQLHASKTEDGQPDVRGESIQFDTIEEKTAFLTGTSPSGTRTGSNRGLTTHGLPYGNPASRRLYWDSLRRRVLTWFTIFTTPFRFFRPRPGP